MKKRILTLILLIVFLLAGAGVYLCVKNAPGEEEYMAAALAYLEEQKAVLSGTERISVKIDPQTDISGYDIDKVISWIKRAAQVRRVKMIPELAYPHVYVGDQMTGNNEKLYYTQGRKIFEFSLGETDSLGFLLYLCGGVGLGETYPEAREAFSEGVIRQLQEEIVFGDQDVVAFVNGYLDFIDIKTPETAEMLFSCIRNCVHITDLTDVCLFPAELPIQINGQGHGTFNYFHATYQETGQFIEISFSPEDSKKFYDYVMSLQRREEGNSGKEELNEPSASPDITESIPAAVNGQEPYWAQGTQQKGRLYQNLNLDGIGESDDEAYVSIYNFGDDYHAPQALVLRVHLGTGETMAEIFPIEGFYEFNTGRLFSEDRDAIILSISGYGNWNATDILVLRVSPADPARQSYASMWTALDTGAQPNGMTLDILRGKDASWGLDSSDGSTLMTRDPEVVDIEGSPLQGLKVTIFDPYEGISKEWENVIYWKDGQWSDGNGTYIGKWEFLGDWMP